MSAKKRKTLTPRSMHTREAISIQESVDAVQDSLDRFKVLYEEGGDVDAAMADLLAYVGDLEDAVEKVECR